MSELEKNLETTEVSEGADTAAEPEVSPEVDSVNSAELEAPEEGEEAFDNTDAEDSFDYSQDSVENDAPLEDMNYLEPQDSGEFSEVSDNGTEESEDDLESWDDRELEEPAEYESSTPENTEDIPEDTDEIPEPAEEIPEGTDETPEPSEEIPEGTDENPEPTEEIPEGTDEPPEPVEENPEGTDETPEPLEENPEGADETPEPVKENPEGADETPEPVEEIPEGTDENPEPTEEIPEGTDENPEPTEEIPEGADENPEPAEGNAEATDDGAEDVHVGDALVDGADKSANENSNQLEQQRIDDLKDRLRQSQAERAENGPVSHYSDWEQGNPYQNRCECPLSEKNFDKLMEARGLDKVIDDNGKTVAQNIKESFDGPMTVSNGFEGDRYTMMYGDNKASGNYLAGQEARDLSASERVDKYALPPSNDASHIRDVQLSKDQHIISGEVAPQPEFANQANDGIERSGGAKQYVTDGGYRNEAVKDAYRDIDTVRKDMSDAEKSVYDSSDTSHGMVNGREALIRNDIDYQQTDSKGRTNLERMDAGLAPLDSNGKSFELHHMGQKMDAPLAELSQSEHRGKGVDTVLHDKSVTSDIDRNAFQNEKSDYWKARAAQIKSEGEVV